MKTPVSAPLQADSDKKDKLGEEIILLSGQLNAAHDRLLKLIAELDESKARSGGTTVRSSDHWPGKG